MRPWVSTNLAISADGKISSPARIPSSWTSAADHARLALLRKNAGALLVGRGTLEADRMTLSASGNPLRCIVSRSGFLNPELPIFKKPGGEIHLLVTGGDEPSAPPEVRVHRNSLSGFLEVLAEELHIASVHCEGGGQLIRALAALDAIDEFHLTIAGHTLFGGATAPTPTGIAENFLPSSRHFTLSRFEPQPNNGECFVTYRRAPPP